MNKQQLIETVALKVGLPKRTLQTTLDTILDTIKAEVVNGDSVTLVGFGTFSAKQREARVCTHPQTGEKIDVPAKKVPAFKAGKQFKVDVNA